MANVYYWHRNPGTFVNKKTGVVFPSEPTWFTGDEQEWWETFWETCVDVAMKEYDPAAPLGDCLYLRADTKFRSWIEGCVIYRISGADKRTTFIKGLGNTVEVHANDTCVGTVTVLSEFDYNHTY